MPTPSVQENKKRGAGNGHKKWDQKLTVGNNCDCCFSHFHASPSAFSHARRLLVQHLRPAGTFFAGFAAELTPGCATDEARTTNFGSRRMCCEGGTVPFLMRSSASFPASSPSLPVDWSTEERGIRR